MPATIKAMARGAITFTGALGHPRRLVGHSMGGLVAQGSPSPGRTWFAAWC